MFGHEMRVVDYRAWFCDDRECGTLLVGLEIPSLYEMHNGTGFLVFDKNQAKDYLDGKQTLRGLVLTRLEDEEKPN